MTTVLNTVRSWSRRTGLLTLVAVIVLPVLITAAFTGAQREANKHLDRIHAAVVNLDEPVTVNKQLVPLGRVLVAELTGNHSSQNIGWTLTDTKTAAKGLADGHFATVLTIPKTFSADATSMADPLKAVRANVRVQVSPSAGVADPIIGLAIANAAAKALNTDLTAQFIATVFEGFSTLHDKLAPAASGAAKLTSGAKKLANGLDSASTGGGKLAHGMHDLAGGAGALDGGAAQLASGADQLATGLDRAHTGSARLADGTQGVASGAAGLADGLTRLSNGLDTALAQVMPQLSRLIAYLQDHTGSIKAAIAKVTAELDKIKRQIASLQASCRASQEPPPKPACDTVAVLAQLVAALQDAINAAGFGSLQQMLDSAVDFLPTAVHDIHRFQGGLSQTAQGSRTLATGARQVAGGARSLETGIGQAATGSHRLADGARRLSSGAHDLAGGAATASGGADKLASGLHQLSGGAQQVSSGSGRLATGLNQAVQRIPDYDAAQRNRISQVAAQPVTAGSGDYSIGSNLGAAYFAALALAIAGVVMFLVRRAVPFRVLTARSNSLLLALRAFVPGAIAAVVQAVLLTVVIALMLGLGAVVGVKFALVALLAGLTFAAINQTTVAVLGGRGRFVAAVLLIVCAPAALVSTAPEPIRVLINFTPIAPTVSALRAVLTHNDGLAPNALRLVVWLVIGFGVTVVAIARKRTVRPAALVQAGQAVQI